MATSRGHRAKLPSGSRLDKSDDELGHQYHPWVWIYDDAEAESNPNREKCSRKHTRPCNHRIIGASTGSFHCSVGDTVLLRADSSNEAWVAIVCDFIEEDDDGEMAAEFMWFSSEKEIRNKDKKRTDYYWNELYITASCDINPLASITGKATVVSLQVFSQMYPNGKIPKGNPHYGKLFVCRRGCNTRTATYTDEFVWETVYQGPSFVNSLAERIMDETKVSRTPRKKRLQQDKEDGLVRVKGAVSYGAVADRNYDYAAQPEEKNDNDEPKLGRPRHYERGAMHTPKKKTRVMAQRTPTPSRRKYVPRISGG